MLTSYRRVLSIPGAAAFSSTGAVSRLPISMTALGIVLLVSEQSGSYGRAGLVAAAYTLAQAAFAPLQGRLVDRLGQGRVLWVAGAGYALGVALTIVSVRDGWSTPWPYLWAAVAGLATPQTGNLVRTRWTHVVGDRALLTTAFAIEAVLDEVVFIVGPLLVTFLTLEVAQSAGLASAALAAVAGSWCLALQRRTEPPRSLRGTGPRAPLGWHSLGPVVAASLGLGVLFGSTEVIVVAFCAEQGAKGSAGLVLAVWAAGSLTAGVVVGALPSPADPLRRLRVAVALLGLLFAPLPFLSHVTPLAIGMFLAGGMISPTLIEAMRLIEIHVPASRLTEALSWTTLGMAVGVAPGAAVAGQVVDAQGASSAFLVPLVAGLAATVVVWVFAPSTTRTDRTSSDRPGGIVLGTCND